LHLLLFLGIGNVYGANIATDIVFFIYAPVVVLMSVGNGVAEVVVMPSVHRAQRLNCTKTLLAYLFRRGAQFTLIATLVVLTVAYLLEPRATLPVVALLMPTPLLATTSSILMGFLNAEARFQQAVLGPVYGSVIALPVLLMSSTSATSLALVLLAFECGRSLGLILHTRGLILECDDSRSSQVRKLFPRVASNARVQALGSFLLAITPLIDMIFARSLGPSAVTLVEYASKLWNAVPLLFVGSIAVIYFYMSKDASNGNASTISMIQRVTGFGTMAICISAIGIALSEPIIETLYGHGALLATKRKTLSTLLNCYLVGAFPFVCALLYVKAFSSVGKVRFLTSAATLAVCSKIVFNMIFIRFFGIYGIGLSTSTTNLLILIYLAYSYRSIQKRDHEITHSHGNC
jgi:putative peptidoglycan lipid II flippase